MIKYLKDVTLRGYSKKQLNTHGWSEVHPSDLLALISEVREARLFAATVSRGTMDMQALLDEARYAQSVNPNSARLIAGPREAPEPHWEVKWGNAPSRSATPEGTSVGWEPFAVDDGKIYMRRQV